MNLIWHLIKKDLRATRIWLILWVAACATHLVLRLIQLSSGDSALPPNFASTGRPDHLALYVLMLLIAPQIVQLDPPVSGRSFWKTLPIARWRLLSAKMLLLTALFVVLPAACEFAYFTSAGFGEHTWAAVSIWAWRALPPVALVLGASVLSRDLRITALIVAAAAIMLPVGGLNFLVTGWRPEVMRFAIPFSVVTVAAIGVALLVWQYLSAGRFKWAILIALLGVGWWSKSPAPLPTPRPQFAGRVTSPAKQPVTIPMPDGMRVEISALPPTVSTTTISNQNDTKWTGTNFNVSTVIQGIPPDTIIQTAWFDAAKLDVAGQTLQPRQTSSADYGYFRTRGLPEAGDMDSDDVRRFTFVAGYFDLDGVEWKSPPTSLTATMKLRLARNKRLAVYPVAPGVLWSGKLDSLAMKAPVSTPRGFSVGTRISTVDLPAATLNTVPPCPPGKHFVFRFMHKTAKHQTPFGTLSNRNLGEIEWSTSGGNSPNYREGWRLDLTRRIREFPGTSTVATQNNDSSRPPLYREREGALYRNSDDWEIQAFDTEVLGVIEIPVHFANINPPEAQWLNAKNKEREALGETLDGIVLKNAPAPADIEEYVRRLCLATRFTSGTFIEHHQNTILVKLAAVGPENIPVLLRWAKLQAPPIDWENYRSYNDGWMLSARTESNQAYSGRTSTLSQYLMRVINDILRPADKALALANLTADADLLPAITEHGWLKEALDVMCERAAIEPLPPKWIDHLLASDSAKTTAALVEQCRLGSINEATLERASRRPDFPTREAATNLWRTATNRTAEPASLLHLFAFACKVGVAEAPGDLATLLSDDGRNYAPSFAAAKADLKGELVRLISWRSDCPLESTAARAWLNKNAAKLRFNDTTARYELIP